MSTVKLSWIAVGAVALGGALWFTLSPKQAADAPAAASQPAPQQANPASNGIKVFIDPETGKLRAAEPGEAAALTPSPATLRAPGTLKGPATFEADAAPSEVPGGGVSVLVPEDRLTYSVATKGPDGKVKLHHATGKVEAEAILKAPQKKEVHDVR